MGKIGQKIHRALDERRRTQQALADHLGINRVSVTQWGSREGNPSPERLPAIADFLDVPVEWLLSEEEEVPASSRRPSSADVVEFPRRPRTKGQRVTPAAIVPSERLVAGGARTPVYAGAQAGDGRLIISLDEIDWVKTPSVLENVKGGYGILIDGESMVPAFWPGDVALVHPHLRPARQKNVVLYHTPPDGAEAEAIIKQLNGWNDREWHLEQWNPHREFDEFRQEWPICHRVVGKYDAR